MKLFNSLIRIFVLVGFATTSIQALAGDRWIASSSGGDKLEILTQDLKTLFPTKEDHRQIVADTKSLERVAKTWTWRFEPYQGGSALRVNGKIQMTFKVIDNENNIYEVNNQPLQVSKGLSYASYKKQIKKIMANHHVSLDQLFFDRAHAIAPFFGLAVFGAGGLAAHHQANKSPQRQCIRAYCQKSKYRNLQPKHFQTRGAASSYGWVTDSHRSCDLVLTAISKKWPDFVKKNPQYPAAACVAKKTINNGKEWGLKQKVAQDHCVAVQKCLYTDNTGYKQPAPTHTPFTPICNKDKQGRYSAGCKPYTTPVTYTPGDTPFKPICNKDKQGNYSPGCQPATPEPAYEQPAYEPPGNAERGGRD